MGFIDTMRRRGHAVESICWVLSDQGCQIAARTYRAWRTRPVAARTITDAQVMNAIQKVCVDQNGRATPESLYGRRKMTALLRRQGLPVARCTVDRAMRALGRSGVRRSKGTRTTIPAKNGTRAGDLLDRDFAAAAPNLKWVADFTYVRTWGGFVYVAFVVDCFAQKIVAWHAATSRDARLVTTPLGMAVWARDREGRALPSALADRQLICHSDAGTQYTSIAFTEHLELEGINPSIGSVGDAYDNALMETVIGLFKTECVRTTVFHSGPYKTISEVEFATAGWVDWWNNRRLHGKLEMLTPVEYENAHYAARNLEIQPT